MFHRNDPRVSAVSRQLYRWLVSICCIFAVILIVEFFVTWEPISHMHMEVELHNPPPLVKVDWMAAISSLHY